MAGRLMRAARQASESESILARSSPQRAGFRLPHRSLHALNASASLHPLKDLYDACSITNHRLLSYNRSLHALNSTASLHLRKS
uniref:Uncharacterized protein n=1 Tax=Kalanchoe fedtschenkoi TaxID=63787 RepID=A0A7N0TIB9_KALFE